MSSSFNHNHNLNNLNYNMMSNVDNNGNGNGNGNDNHLLSSKDFDSSAGKGISSMLVEKVPSPSRSPLHNGSGVGRSGRSSNNGSPRSAAAILAFGKKTNLSLTNSSSLSRSNDDVLSRETFYDVIEIMPLTASTDNLERNNGTPLFILSLESWEQRLSDFHELVCCMIQQLEIPNHLRQGSIVMEIVQKMVKLFDYYSKGEAQKYLNGVGASMQDINVLIRLSNRFSREMKQLIRKLTMDHSEGLEFMSHFRDSPLSASSNILGSGILSESFIIPSPSPVHVGASNGFASSGSCLSSPISRSNTASPLSVVLSQHQHANRLLVQEYDQILASLTRTMLQLTDLMKRYDIQSVRQGYLNPFSKLHKTSSQGSSTNTNSGTGTGTGSGSGNSVKLKSARFLDLWPVFEGMVETIFRQTTDIFDFVATTMDKITSEDKQIYPGDFSRSSSRNSQKSYSDSDPLSHDYLQEKVSSLQRSISLIQTISIELASAGSDFDYGPGERDKGESNDSFGILKGLQDSLNVLLEVISSSSSRGIGGVGGGVGIGSGRVTSNSNSSTNPSKSYCSGCRQFRYSIHKSCVSIILNLKCLIIHFQS